MTPSLRPALPADAPAIAALHAANWRAGYRADLAAHYLDHDVLADRQALWTQRLQAPTAPGQHLIVATHGDALLGFACACVNEDPVWGHLLDNLHVRAETHGTGLGARLLAAVADHCAAACGQAGLYLWVLQSNTQAQGFYTAQGATNAEPGVWDAPGGSQVPTFRFTWQPGRLPTSGRPKPPRGAPA
ncbi:GNAT family N-acetyltransferase [Acidovorax sp. SUPP3334]|uniref:GNAT family N-acetyltransferase n=1 Tax=Acidovorax sp. SUPP3334 TaxID=2920881 RepID=UPI0023DE3C99|nr:GNAT family N-acetyltransferase [Acidovorax sp. SUPP3334]GKT24492.1 GNAT family N-acetyltransferase [Acidovorax sp. SUPP3334]